MRNLKKVLALGLAMVMAFGLMISAAAFTDDATIVNDDAAQLLTQLKIISGFPDGSFKPEGNITRAQISKMIYVAMRKGVDDLGANFVNASVPLTDIASHWAKGYIKYAYGANIVAGFPNGTFQPDANVTGYQAAKMMLTALGYSSTIEQYAGTGWDFRVAVDAASAGLLEGIEDVDLSVALSRDNAAQLIYNGIFANMVTYDEDGILTEGETFAETKLGLVELSGILLANGYASINNVTVPDSDEYKILGDYDDDGADDDTLTITGKADISLIGQNVTAFVKIDSGADADDLVSDDVVKTYGAVVATAGENTVVVGYDNAFNDDNDTDAGTQYCLNYGNWEVVVFNTSNQAFVDADADGVLDGAETTEVLPVQGDRTTYIDNDDDGVYDIVVELEMAYDDDISIDSDDETISGAGIFDDDDFEDVVGVDAIKDGDHVVAYPIASNGSDFVGVVAACTTVTGTLKGTRGGDEVKIDSTYYEISFIDGTAATYATVTDSDNFGTSILFYIDLGGYIVDFDTDTDDAPDKFCGVRDVQWAGAGVLGDDAKVAVTLEDGTEAVYTVEEVGSAIAVDHDLTDHADLDADNTYFAGSVFTYSLNADNEITLEEKVADYTAIAATNVTSAYSAGGSTLRTAAGTFVVRTSTVFFNYDAGEDEFTVYVGKSNSPDLAAGVDALVYDDGDFSTATATVVLATAASGTADGNFALVLNADVDYDDGDDYLTVTAFDGSSIITLTGDSGVAITDGDADIAEGDVVEYTLDGSVVSEFDVLDVHTDYTTPVAAGDDYVFLGGFAYDFDAENDYITMRIGATVAGTTTLDATFDLDDDVVIGQIADLDAATVKTTGIDLVTDEDDIEDDYAATEANVVIQVDEDGVVVAVYYISDDTITVAP